MSLGNTHSVIFLFYEPCNVGINMKCFLSLAVDRTARGWKNMNENIFVKFFTKFTSYLDTFCVL